MPTFVLDPPSKTKDKDNQTSSSSTTTNNNSNKEDDEDQVTSAIRKTGCLKLHEKLQECYFEKKDWRDCSNEMKEFRLCMQKIKRSTIPTSSSSKQ